MSSYNVQGVCSNISGVTAWREW